MNRCHFARTCRRWLALAWIASLVLACSENKGPARDARDGPAGCKPPPTLKKTCENCENDCDCEAGHTCESGVCAPMVKSASGESCECSAVCQEGLKCIANACAGPVFIDVFDVTPAWGDAPVIAKLFWTVSGPEGAKLTCRLDLDGDGDFDETVSPCGPQGWFEHTYSEPGAYHPVLEVDDGKGHAVSAKTEVFSNHLEFKDNVVFPEKLAGFKSVVVGSGSVEIKFEPGSVIPKIDPGTILWGTSGTGYLRKVIDVHGIDDGLLLDVEFATIEDGIKHGFYGVRDYRPSMAGAKCLKNCDGIVLTPMEASWSGSGNSISSPLEVEGEGFIGLKLSFGEIPVRSAVGVVAFKVQPEFGLGVEIKRFTLVVDWGVLKELTVEIRPAFTAELDVRLEAFKIPETDLFPPAVVELGVCWIGPIPIVPRLDLFARCGASAGYTFKVKTGVEAFFTGGISYKDGQVHTDELKPYFEPNLEVNADELGLAELKCTLGPDIDILLFGLLGPYFEPALFLKGEAVIDEKNDCLAAVCKGGLELGFGGKISAFFKEIKAEAKVTLAEAEFLRYCLLPLSGGENMPEITDICLSCESWGEAKEDAHFACPATPCSTPGTSNAVCLDAETSVACMMKDGCWTEVDGSLAHCPQGCDPDTGTCKGCPTNICNDESWTPGPHCNGMDLVVCDILNGCIKDVSTITCENGCDPSENECIGCIPDCTGRECGLDPVCKKENCGECPIGKQCSDDGKCICKGNACSKPGTHNAVCESDASIPCTTFNGCPALAVGQEKYCGPGKCDNVTGDCIGCDANACTKAGKSSGKACIGGSLYECSTDASKCTIAKWLANCLCNEEGTDCKGICSPPCGINEECGQDLQCHCKVGFDDCDVLSPGCETDIQASAQHCGKCNNPCKAGEKCVAKQCVPENPVVTVDPALLDFGEVAMGTTKVLSSYVKNLTGQEATFTCTATGATTAFQWTCPLALLPDQGHILSVTFAPPKSQVTTTYSATLTLEWTTESYKGQTKVEMKGTAVAQPLSFVAEPPELVFQGVKVGGSLVLDVKVVMKGDGAASVKDLKLSGDSEFTVYSDYCSGKQLQSTGNHDCTIEVKFAPHSVGSFEATLHVITSIGTLDVPIEGTGTANCTSECSANDKQCVSSTSIKTCIKDGDCYKWSAPAACQAWTVCDYTVMECVPCGDEGQKCCADAQCKDGSMQCNKSTQLCQKGDPCAGYAWNPNLKATAQPGNIVLTWSKESAQYDACVVAYAILRSTGGPPQPAGYSTVCKQETATPCQVCTTTASTCSDAAVTPGTTYFYLLYPLKGGQLIGGGIPMGSPAMIKAQ